MAETCRAVVFDGAGGYEVREFSVPRPGPGEVVLATEAVGMCHSDVSQLHGIQHVPGECSPIVGGHEIVGRVHAMGEGANFGVEVGDRVAVDLVLRAPVTRENPFGLGGVYGFTFGLEDGHGLWGGYGEYMGIKPGTQLLKLTEDVSAAELTIFEPLGSVCHWFERACLNEGDTVVIQGPGHMGLIATAVAAHMGAGMVIVTGTGADAHRLEAAKRLGADHTIDVTAEDLVPRVMELTDDQGPEVVMDLSAGATEPIRAALDMVKFNGHILLGGLKDLASTELVTDLIVLKGLTVTGGPGSTPESMRESAALLNAKVLPTADLLGDVFGMDELDQAFALLERTDPDRDTVRVALTHV